jgi:hypothetical protein
VETHSNSLTYRTSAHTRPPTDAPLHNIATPLPIYRDALSPLPGQSCRPRLRMPRWGERRGALWAPGPASPALLCTRSGIVAHCPARRCSCFQPQRDTNMVAAVRGPHARNQPIFGLVRPKRRTLTHRRASSTVRLGYAVESHAPHALYVGQPRLPTGSPLYLHPTTALFSPPQAWNRPRVPRYTQDEPLLPRTPPCDHASAPLTSR